MNEKGFAIRVQTRSKGAFSEASLGLASSKFVLQDGNRERITLTACVCVDGSRFRLSLIYYSQFEPIHNSWLQEINPNTHDF